MKGWTTIYNANTIQRTTIYNANTIQKNMAVAKITVNKVDFKVQDIISNKKSFDNEKGQNSVGYNNPKCL